MKVSEMIKTLSQLDPDKEVRFMLKPYTSKYVKCFVMAPPASSNNYEWWITEGSRTVDYTICMPEGFTISEKKLR